METNFAGRLWRFAWQPWVYQRRKIISKIYKYFPGFVVPIRLPFGPWWLAQYEFSTDQILNPGYEPAETAFMRRILAEGMTVIDVGANRGYYTLLASQKVGHSGRVIAFEPTPRERKFLRWNLFLNRCRNVTVEPVALGSQTGESDLFIADGYLTGCHCLRSRAHEFAGKTVRVGLRTLDEYILAQAVGQVHLLKMDIEGGEFDVIRGATKLFEQRPRPIILCELIDQLTQLWDYEAREIVIYLNKVGFQWFEMVGEGLRLAPLPIGKTSFNGNYVAVPEEKMASVQDGGWLK